ncbi:histidine phosphatase family protein [Pseudomonas sp. RIT-To-2]|uniref:histidine phosphatase family protein n=1 Tax=Pseudomonas sp. RIT-To-2 TaxID=3462541 RepID=UPI00241318F7
MSRPAPTLLLIRHGETAWNAQRLLQGRRDIPLNDTGRGQAARSGLCLKALPLDLTTWDFVASPLARTRETMEIVRRGAGLTAADYRQDERLVEIHFGEWEGLSWEQIREQAPHHYEERWADPLNYPAPGGENYPMVFDRVEAVLQGLTGDTVIVAHAGILRSVLALRGGVDAARIPLIEIPQDRVLVVRDGGFAWLQASTELHNQTAT